MKRAIGVRPAAVAAISPQGRVVLGALREGANGQLPIHAVLRGVRRAGTRAAVARASLSRTLRRLWRAGLVELRDEAGRTLTGEVQQRQRYAALARHEPEAAYRAYVARCRATGNPLEYFHSRRLRRGLARGGAAAAASARPARAVNRERTAGG